MSRTYRRPAPGSPGVPEGEGPRTDKYKAWPGLKAARKQRERKARAACRKALAHGLEPEPYRTVGVYWDVF